METVKSCNRCQVLKPVTEFFKDKNHSSGYYSICKTCKKASYTKWRIDNKDRYNAKMREYNAAHYHRLRLQRYKLSPERHAEILLFQKGVCAICGELPRGKRPLAVDHSHQTGKIRGLLCYGCNRALSTLERPGLLQKAMEYLLK